MKKLKIDLENCYGIRRLQAEFDFGGSRACAIYAPNGAMKSSLAKTFQDVAEGAASRDRIFPSRATVRLIKDEKGVDLIKESVLVVRPYDEVLGHSAKTSTLLVNATLREEYEKLHLAIDASKDAFLKAMKAQSGSKRDLEKEISAAFTPSEDKFERALSRIRDEVLEQKAAPFADVRYDTIFDEKALAFLATKDFKTAIEDYIRKYNELLAASTYFKKGTFNYYNAATIAKSLADHGFFKAKHSLNLNADARLEISSQKELEELVSKEKEGISKDAELRKKFAEIEKLLAKNVTVRDFETYLASREDLLPALADVKTFKEDVWKSYIVAQVDLYKDLIDKYRAAEERKKEIEEKAAEERTQWEEVIDIFNGRFFVPFKLAAKNRIPVILGQEPMLSLGFTFGDGPDSASVERSDLIEVLSTGEKKALYVLNIIFEIEVRRKTGQETLIVVDDIADSFDYKNKYAIIQYLKEVAETSHFCQIILTHNFDFFRTVQSRFVSYSHCYMASKSAFGLTLSKATGIKNVFVTDWKKQFFEDGMKRIACIPFIRNLIEFTRGDDDPDFATLTSLLHWKPDSGGITHKELDDIFLGLFGGAGSFPDAGKSVVDSVHHQAGECLKAGEGVNFEHKIVLSIAVRLAAEKYVVVKINDPAFCAGIASNQTPKLLGKFQELFPAEQAAIGAVQRVILMTPENIHLNSFMYEPILDMSDEHLRKLYSDVTALV